MKARWFLRYVALLALLLPVVTCAGPSAGELVVELTTTRADVHAVQFAITAAESKMVENVTPACSGCQVFSTRVGDRDMRGVVTGTIQTGPVLRVLVSDVGEAGAYAARVTDAANAEFLLLGTGDLTLRVLQP